MIKLTLSLLALACAMPATLHAKTVTDAEISPPSPCEGKVRVRNRIERPGAVLKPAALALTHVAGNRTTGKVNAALLFALGCGSENGEHGFDIGAEYALDSDPDAPAEAFAIGANYAYGWSGAQPGNADRPWKEVTVNASVGRNIEAGVGTGYLALGFSAIKLDGQRPRESGEAGTEYAPGFGLLGGMGQRKQQGSEDYVAHFDYGIKPSLAYFRGYQPANIGGALHISYATLDASFKLYPFAGQPKLGDLSVSAGWIGRRRIEGSTLLPEYANLISASLALGLKSGSAQGGRLSNAEIALAYTNGRDPESGFERGESFELTFTYLLDRRY